MDNPQLEHIVRMKDRLLAIAIKGSVQDLERLLQDGLDPRTSFQGSSLLQHYLTHAKDDQLDVFQRLLQAAGALRECSSLFGCTPLMTALMNKRFNMARMLIEHGDDVNACNSDGETLVHLIAANNGSAAATSFRLLESHGAHMDVVNEKNGVTPLMSACANLDATMWLLDRLPHRLESTDSRGYTPLMHAVEVGASDVVDVYLARGASLHARGDDEMTAMDLAKQEEHWSLLKKLQAFDNATKARSLVDQITRGAHVTVNRRAAP